MKLKSLLEEYTNFVLLSLNSIGYVWECCGLVLILVYLLIIILSLKVCCLCVKRTWMCFSANWAAVCRVWLSWESRLLRIELLSLTPFSVAISEFFCEGACARPAKWARRRSVRERYLSHTDSSSTDRRRCSSVSRLWKEGRMGWFGKLELLIGKKLENNSIPLLGVPAGKNSKVSVVPHIIPGDVILLCRQRHGLHTFLQTQHTGKHMRQYAN